MTSKYENTEPKYIGNGEDMYKYIDGTYHHSFNDGHDWIRCTCSDLSEPNDKGEQVYQISTCPVEIEFDKIKKGANNDKQVE